MSRVTINGGTIDDVDLAGAELEAVGFFDGVDVRILTLPQGTFLARDACQWHRLRAKIMRSVRNEDAKGVEGDLLFLDRIGLPKLITPDSLSSLRRRDAMVLLRRIRQ